MKTTLSSLTTTTGTNCLKFGQSKSINKESRTVLSACIFLCYTLRIKDYLEGEKYKPSRNRENIIFLSEVYGSPVTIKKMFISESKESLIRRNLFIVTRDDKLYMIGRELVSTRRPKETALFSNEAYPPYQYLIPYEPAKFFSYNINLYGLKNVHFSPSDM